MLFLEILDFQLRNKGTWSQVSVSLQLLLNPQLWQNESLLL